MSRAATHGHRQIVVQYKTRLTVQLFFTQKARCPMGSAPFVFVLFYASGRLPSQLPIACKSVSEG